MIISMSKGEMLFPPHFLRQLSLLFQFYFFLLLKEESICEVNLQKTWLMIYQDEIPLFPSKCIL